MSKNSLFTVACLLFAGALSVADAHAKDAKRTLLYGMTHFPPFAIIENEKYSGRDISLLLKLANRAGFTIKFLHCEWIRCIQLSKVGRVDLLSTVTKTREREEFLHFMDPAFPAGHVAFWVKKGQSSSIKSIADLAGKRIGKEKGTVVFSHDLATLTQSQPYEARSFQSLFQMLLSDKLDAVIGGSIATHKLLDGTVLRSKLALAEFNHTDLPGYLALSKNSPHFDTLRPKLEAALQQMQQNGELDRYLNWGNLSP